MKPLHLSMNAITAICLFALPLSLLAQTPVQRADALLADWRGDATPGGAVAVVRDGEVVFQRCVGLADVDSERPITTQTPFYLASVAKQFTAFCVLDLAARGKLKLDDPVKKHIAELPAYDPAPTLRDLIDHRSGLRDFYELGVLAGWDLQDLPTQQEVVAMICRQQELNFAPGSEFVYSNSGYLLLAEVVHRVTGTSLRKYARTRIFAPLGMSTAEYRDATDQVVEGAAIGHAAEGPVFRRKVPTSTLHGAGGLYGSLEDVIRWVQNFENATVGGPGLQTSLRTPRDLREDQGRNPVIGRYASGLMVSLHDGRATFHHGGGFPGFQTHVQHFPDAQLSVIVLCNRSNGPPASQLAEGLADVFLPELDARETAPTPAASTTVPPGAYFFRDQHDVVMFGVQRGRGVFKSMSFDLSCSPSGERAFTGFGTELPIEFEVSKESLRLAIKGQAARTFVPIRRNSPTGEELAAIAGTYSCPELGTELTLAVRGGRLAITDKLALPFQPFNSVTKDLHFSEPRLMIEVLRDKAGRPHELRLSTRRVRNLRFRR